MTNPRRARGDRGSVLTFGIGISIFMLLLVTVAINLASMWSTKVTLRTIADGAALAGAQAVDTSMVYKYGTVSSVRLSPSLARNRITAYVNQPIVNNRVIGLEISSIRVANNKVTLVLACQPDLPFGYLLPTSIAKIEATATAAQEVRK